MKLTLKKLTLVNFQGQKQLTVDFSEETIISGKNASGKSTIFNAFLWCLFGKDAQDRKDFGIKTYDENGIVIPKIDHEVTAVIDIDGVETKLTRILREMWVKKRGEEIPEFTGNETVFFVNDVPYKSGEYQTYINDIIPESTFKLLTSPAYFNSLKWNERRGMLISIVGSPTDEEIAGNDLVSLLETMRNEKKTIENLKKEYAAKKKCLKEELSLIPARIDETTRNTPPAQDWRKIDAEIKTNDLQISAIEAEILDKSKGIEDAVRTRSHLLVNKSNLETKLQTIEFKARQEFETKINKKSQDIQAKQHMILSYKQSILNYRQDIKSLNDRIEELNKQNAELRTRWASKNSETLQWNEGTTCPTCGQSLPDELVEQKMIEAEQKFNASKTYELQTIQQYGVTNKKRIEELNQEIKTIETKIEFVEKDMEVIVKQLEEFEKTPAVSQSVESIIADNTEYHSIKQQISEILIPEAIEVPDTTELQNRKHELLEKNNQLKAIITLKETIEKMNERVKELKAQEKEFSQQIASTEKVEFQIETFIKRSITEVETRVNALFPTVKFRMFEQNINGGETPACECLINGVPYGDCNSAHKTLAGLDIISVFSKIQNMYCPVFIDNSEGINFIPSMENQIIKMYVTEDEKLTITNL